MMKYRYWLLFFINLSCCAQNKYGNTWLIGNVCSYVNFGNGLSKPYVGQLIDTAQAYSGDYPLGFSQGHSSISDPATGELLFYANEGQVAGRNFKLMENGDNLCDSIIYNRNGGPGGNIGPQTTLILPKKGSQYYLFHINMNDSTMLNYYNNPSAYYGTNELFYSIIDMDSNDGNGKVIKKRVPLIKNRAISKVGMQACKHANGRDWWLVKHAADSNLLFRWLITSDTIIGPYEQYINDTKFNKIDFTGQSNFSWDGNHYSYFVGYPNQLAMLSDFDRCMGLISNSQIVMPPIDSSGLPNPHLPKFIWDSVFAGLAISPNGRFAYFARQYNIYQYDMQEPDSSKRWVRIWKGPDTSYFAFDLFGILQNGPDGRIYVGKFGGVMKFLSVIDSPNNKGLGASFCPKCLRLEHFKIDPSFFPGSINDPPNMPNYNLGALLGSACDTIRNIPAAWVLYPNPAQDKVHIKVPNNQRWQNAAIQIFNLLGQQVLRQSVLVNVDHELIIDTKSLAGGVYFFSVNINNERQLFKVVIQ